MHKKLHHYWGIGILFILCAHTWVAFPSYNFVRALSSIFLFKCRGIINNSNMHTGLQVFHPSPRRLCVWSTISSSLCPPPQFLFTVNFTSHLISLSFNCPVMKICSQLCESNLVCLHQRQTLYPLISCTTVSTTNRWRLRIDTNLKQMYVQQIYKYRTACEKTVFVPFHL